MKQKRRKLSIVQEAEWTLYQATYRKAYREAEKEARQSFERLSAPTGYAMVRGPGFGVAVRLEHVYGETAEARPRKLTEGEPA